MAGMSLLTVRLAVLSAMVATAMGQQCYYPDGSSSTDTPCTTGSGASSCCGANEYCMASGLCLGAGLFSRGTCTDKTWESEACAGFCRTENTGTIIPCPTTSSEAQTFICGFNTSTCASADSTFTLPDNTTVVLRPSQLDSLKHFTPHVWKPSVVAGLTLGLTLPLLLALLITLHLLRLSRARQQGPKLMYKLPDNHSDFPPTHGHHLRPSPSSYSLQSGFTLSRRASVGTTHSGTGKPAHFQSFVERYGKKEHVAELGTGVKRWELDGIEAGGEGGGKRGWLPVELPGKRTSVQ